ncbi:hypothetical protein NMY22_g1403 [Coprinellus aureogranulatus]|nr:hypothetical protein NMY22_g1403 [Coprinellus aureogranulatus]
MLCVSLAEPLWWRIIDSQQVHGVRITRRPGIFTIRSNFIEDPAGILRQGEPETKPLAVDHARTRIRGGVNYTPGSGARGEGVGKFVRGLDREQLERFAMSIALEKCLKWDG